VTDSRFSQEITLLPADNRRLSNFCGQFDAHLHQIEKRLNVEIANRGNQFKITGLSTAVKAACIVMKKTFDSTSNETITPEHIHLSLQESSIDQLLETKETQPTEIDTVFIKTKQAVIKGLSIIH
jgi:phosphate starvation-inducible PhoH-like protein